MALTSPFSKSSWRKVSFGDVVRNVDESVQDAQSCGLECFVGLEHIDPESLHIQRWGLIADGTSFTRRFRKGQVLFGKRRAYQRKVAVAEFDGLCSSDILVFEPKDDKLLQELLPFICQTDGFFEHALDTSAGSLSPRTKFKELARYEFHLPPLDEQRRIAEILWAADELTLNWTNYLKASETAKWVLFNRLFWHKIHLSGSIPDNWKSLTLKDCVFERGETSKYPHKKCKYLGLENIEPGLWKTKTFSNSSEFSSNCSAFYEGDLLYGKLRPNLDKAVISTFEGVCTSEILVLCSKPIITNDYLLCHLHSPQFILFNSHQAFGTKMPRTSFDILGNYAILVPPLSEQERIHKEFQDFIAAENNIRNHIDISKKLKNYLLDQLTNIHI